MRTVKKAFSILAVCFVGACTLTPPASPTATQPAPTNTPISTNTGVFTRVPTDTATIPPTASETPSKTLTHTPSATDSPTATATATLTPTATRTATITPTRAPTLTPDVVEQSSDQLAFTTLPPPGYSPEWDCMRTFFDILISATKWTITRRDKGGYFECIGNPVSEQQNARAK